MTAPDGLAAASKGADALLVDLLSRILRRDDSCVDVGANTGQILRHIVRLAPEGRHFSLEPLPHLAASLKEHFPTVTVIAAAVSDQTGTTAFRHVVNDSGYSGMRERRYDRSDPVIETITVPMCRLDDVLPVNHPVRFVKIDVEGAELQVLRGAQRTIRSARPFVYFEHGPGGSDYYGTSPEMVYDLLAAQLRYSIFSPDGWLKGDPPLSREGLRQLYDRGSVWNYFAAPRDNDLRSAKASVGLT